MILGCSLMLQASGIIKPVVSVSNAIMDIFI
jgi:hypothetical protein